MAPRAGGARGVIVDRLSVEETANGVERAARARWRGGEARLTVTVPAELAVDAGTIDASPFLCATLLPAMWIREDLEIDGPVSPRLAVAMETVRETYLDWRPDLHPSRIGLGEQLEPRERADGVGCFFSRGVDSTFSAACPRPGASLARLLFIDRLEPCHSAAVRAEEIRRARGVADRIGLPLTVIDTSLRAFTDPLLRDWDDMAGAGLACVANCLAGALGEVVIPSTDGPVIGPCGTSPLLDPLFSTEAVEIRHDSAAKSRVAKTFWLAAERPELVRGLKVCFAEDTAGNCGRCSKCLATMVALEAAGALDRAEDFPPLDGEALAALDEPLRELTWFGEAAEALDPERHAELRERIWAGLARAQGGPPAPPREDSPGFRHRAGAQMRLYASRAAPRAGVEPQQRWRRVLARAAAMRP